MKQGKALFKRQKKLIVYISIIVFLLDIIFIVLNYYTSKKALDESILATAKSHQAEFNLTLEMTYRNMMQLALFISKNDDLNQLFLMGKNAVIQEGGGAGGVKANQARMELLAKVKPAWDNLTESFNIRQLHYHLGPGSTSFLRVHKPQKYGDNMDDLRHIIVDTNQEKTPRYGFETGRIYSGLRGVYPIWTIDPKTSKEVYVGALETGTSFKQILPVIAKSFATNMAVYLTKNHVESKMWAEFIKQHFKQYLQGDFYLEASSSSEVNAIFSRTIISDHLNSENVNIIHYNNNYLSVYYFPLFDYQSSTSKTPKPVGFVLIWSNISQLISEFRYGIILNILFSIVALIIIEFALFGFLKRQKRLIIAERKAMYDGLTGIYNRGFFNQVLNRMKIAKDQSLLPISCMMCDIDYFKAFNDTYGHQKGDYCIKKVAQTLKQNLRGQEDILARYGGEEFIVLLPKTSANEAAIIAQRMRETIYNLQIENKNSNVSNYVTISIGISSIDKLDDLNVLIEQADKKLYLSKQNGRNQVTI
ncbi:diguanylate cyclase [Thiotrichales bacterium 19S3-7]|nr:diguanylate cyclase [Thiotrichales bacterium 19S3-7]MCF6801944.1 diguanylate cyclase [Thiotrichales bacterium 19S3-11]